jgi:hypothetical protein
LLSLVKNECKIWENCRSLMLFTAGNLQCSYMLFLPFIFDSVYAPDVCKELLPKYKFENMVDRDVSITTDTLTLKS